MAIDPTRGLPSFTEMYNAYKNRGSLGDAVNAGVSGFMEAKAATSKQAKEAAETQEATSHAKWYETQAKGGGQKTVSAASLPDEVRERLAKAGAIDEQGNTLESSAKIAMQGTKQESDAASAADKLAAQMAAFEQKKAHDAEVSKITAERDADRAKFTGNQQEMDAARTVANVTSKETPPGIGDKIWNAVQKPFTKEDTATILNDKQKHAAINALTQKGGFAVGQSKPQVTPSTEQLMAGAHTPAPMTPAPTPLVPRSAAKPGKPKPVFTQEDINALQEGASFIDGSGKVKIKKTVDGVVYSVPVKGQ